MRRALYDWRGEVSGSRSGAAICRVGRGGRPVCAAVSRRIEGSGCLGVQTGDVYKRRGESVPPAASNGGAGLSCRSRAIHNAGSWMAGGTWAQAILFSNELPDAFPVHRLVRRAKGWMELGVRYDGDTCSFKETEQPVRNEELLRYIERKICRSGKVSGSKRVWTRFAGMDRRPGGLPRDAAC